MQTPIVWGGILYCCNDAGVLSCYDAKGGKLLHKSRLGTGGEGFTASPVAAAGKLYFTSEKGTVYVVEAGPSPKIVEANDLGEACMATPAIARGSLFFRTRHHVVRVGQAVRMGE